MDLQEFNFRKESGKKVSEVSRFSGYSGFIGSPVLVKELFSEKPLSEILIAF